MPDYYSYYYDYFNEIYNNVATYDYTQLDGIRDAALNTTIAWVATIAGIILLACLTAAVLVYVLSSVGLFKMAKNLKATAPGLAFVPIANLYLFGRIAQGHANNKKKFPFGWLLLALYFIQGGISAFTSISIVVTQTNIAMGINKKNVIRSIEEMLEFMGTQQLIFNLLSFLVGVIFIVFLYIVLYRVYKIFTPDNAPLYFAFSFLFPFFVPFFLFALRNKPVLCEATEKNIEPTVIPDINNNVSSEPQQENVQAQ